MPLRPLTYDVAGEGPRTLTCHHAKIWPPHWVRHGTAAELRTTFTTLDYERAKTWENVCGLTEMSPAKCPTCPWAVKEDGEFVVIPVVTPAPISQRRRPKAR